MPLPTLGRKDLNKKLVPPSTENGTIAAVEDHEDSDSKPPARSRRARQSTAATERLSADEEDDVAEFFSCGLPINACPPSAIEEEDEHGIDSSSPSVGMARAQSADNGDEKQDGEGGNEEKGGRDGGETRLTDTATAGAGLGWGRGIVADYKKTVVTHWIEEMTNLNHKTVAATFFLFFACVTPAFTFGAIYIHYTHHWMGVVEMMIGTAWCGIFFALVGGQPMVINGGTGPVLAFSGVLYKLSESIDVPFLTFNAWTGIWVTIYMSIAAYIDLNRLIRYCTRFTDEIFALLIAFIFIIDALGNPFSPVGVFYYFQSSHKTHKKYESDPDYSHEAAAQLSLALCLGTTALIFSLRKAKFSPFFCNQIARDGIADFAVVTSILTFTFLANFCFEDVPIEKLEVPAIVAPTFLCCDEKCRLHFPDDCPKQDDPYGPRPWLVDLGDLNDKTWAPLLAAVPAFLAFILVFLDNGITNHLINHPCHKLQHGDAYNYDTVIIGSTIAINSIVGLPWLVAATVRSMNHIHSLATKDRNGKFLKVQETRLTGLSIHLLIAASLAALGTLQAIPVPVLYGVFLFMGLVTLGTNQFWGRIQMFFMQPSKYPKEPYTEFMMHHRMHGFTLIQILLFVALYIVKSINIIAIAFPIVIAICIPIRLYVLPKIFTVDELILIDSNEGVIENWLIEHGVRTEKKQSSDLDLPDEDPFRIEEVATIKLQGPGDKTIEMKKVSSHIDEKNREEKFHSRRIRQSTAATIAMGQDDEDLAEFFGFSPVARNASSGKEKRHEEHETRSVPDSLPSLELVSEGRSCSTAMFIPDEVMSIPESLPSIDGGL